jgi:predicted transcriptional regulator
MVKATAYLGERLAERLRALARFRACSQAALIREALARYLDMEQAGERPAVVGLGRFRSGQPNLARDAEELLRKAAVKRLLELGSPVNKAPGVTKNR